MRITQAGIEGMIGLGFCLLTAHWLSRTLRQVEVEAPSWPRTCYRFITAILTWGMGFYLVLVSLPRLNPWLVDGLKAVLSPGDFAMIVLSCLSLTAGISIRGVARQATLAPAEDVGRRLPAKILVGLLNMAIGLISLMFILASVSQLRGDVTHPWYAPFGANELVARVDERITFKTSSAIYFDIGNYPEAIVPLVASVAILATLIRLFRRSGFPSPIDQLAHEPHQIARFLGSWLAMTGIVLTLFPIFILLGLALMHFGLRWFA